MTLRSVRAASKLAANDDDRYPDPQVTASGLPVRGNLLEPAWQVAAGDGRRPGHMSGCPLPRSAHVEPATSPFSNRRRSSCTVTWVSPTRSRTAVRHGVIPPAKQPHPASAA